MGQVSVLTCHPWIGMLTHTVLEGFITEVNHMYKVTQILLPQSKNIAEATRLWIPINTNGKVECRNRNPNVSLTRRLKSLQHKRCSPKTGQHMEYAGNITHRE